MRTMGRNSVRRMAIAGVVTLGVVLPLAGCAENHEWRVAGSRTNDADRLHPVGAEVRREAIDVPPVAGSSQAQSEAYFAVTKFVRQYLRDGRGVLDVRVASRGGDRTRSFVSAILAENGVAPERVRYGARTDGSTGALIAYTRVAAVAPLTCDDWSEDITRWVEQGAYANWGCASQRNLANMVADPTDLVAPKVADVPIADRAQVNYRTYSTGKSAANSGASASSSGANVATGK